MSVCVCECVHVCVQSPGSLGRLPLGALRTSVCKVAQGLRENTVYRQSFSFYCKNRIMPGLFAQNSITVRSRTD